MQGIRRNLNPFVQNMYIDSGNGFQRLLASLGRGNRRQRRTGQAIADKLGKESRERPDVFLDARFFERGHVRLAFGEGNNRPRIACRRHHRVHEKPSYAPVAVHVGMDIDENKMPERRPDSRMFLCAEQIEEGWHASRTASLFSGTCIELRIKTWPLR